MIFIGPLNCKGSSSSSSFMKSWDSPLSDIILIKSTD